MGEGCGEFARRDDGFAKRGIFVVRGHGAVGSYIFRHVAVGVVVGEVELGVRCRVLGVGNRDREKAADASGALDGAVKV